MKAGRSTHDRELSRRDVSWGVVPVGWCMGLVAVAAFTFVACASESDVESAQAALGPSARGMAPAAMGSVSAEQLARLISPDPVPPPAYPTPFVESETTASRDVYRRALVSVADPLTALIVHIDASTPSAGGSILDVTTIAGPPPRTRRLFVYDGVECAGGVVTVGATVLIHIAAGDATSSGLAGAIGIRHSVLGGALPGLIEARLVSPGVFEVSFPWGRNVLHAAALGGVL